MKEAPTVRSLEIKNKLRAEGKQVYDLGLGENPMPVPTDLKKVLMQIPLLCAQRRGDDLFFTSILFSKICDFETFSFKKE